MLFQAIIGLNIIRIDKISSKGGSSNIENMLKYLQDSRNDMAVDEATKELDGYVESVKSNSLLKGDYMTFGNLIDNMVADERREEREETTARVTKEVTLSMLHESILDLLKDRWDVSEDLQNKILAETDPGKLRALHLTAARSQSLEEFMKKMGDEA